MLETLQHWDADLFQFINGSLGNPVFDLLLPWCREKWFWAPAYLFVGVFSVLNYGRKGWFILFGLVLAVGLADFTSSTLIKKSAARVRPCNDPAMFERVELRVADCGGGYSFTSSHAANHFAAAVIIIGFFGGLARWVRPLALGWASLIAFAQVYVGVHYPADVLGGAALGTAIGWWAVKTVRGVRGV